MSDPPGNAAAYEASDAPTRLIAGLAAGIALFLVLAPFGLRALYPATVNRAVVAPNLSAIPQPRLQADPSADLAEFRRAEMRRLSSYGWVDRGQGIAHLPIDRAVALTLERGLPGWQRP